MPSLPSLLRRIAVLLLGLGLAPLLVAAQTSGDPLEVLADQARGGEAQWLESADGRYLNLVMTPDDGNGGAVFLLHDPHDNPAEPRLLLPLRRELTRLGWRTASLSTTPAGKAAENAAENASPREPALRAALAALGAGSGKRPFRLLLLHGGVLPSEEMLKAFDALVLINVIARDPDPVPPALPLLRIEASRGVGRARGKGRRSVYLPGTDHYLTGYVEFTAHVIHGWAKSLKVP